MYHVTRYMDNNPIISIPENVFDRIDGNADVHMPGAAQEQVTGLVCTPMSVPNMFGCSDCATPWVFNNDNNTFTCSGVPTAAPTASPSLLPPTSPPTTIAPTRSPTLSPSLAPSQSCVHTGVEMVPDIYALSECDDIRVAGLCTIQVLYDTCSTSCCFTMPPTSTTTAPATSPTSTFPTPSPSTSPSLTSPTPSPTVTPSIACIHTGLPQVQDVFELSACLQVRDTGLCHVMALESSCSTTCCYTQPPSLTPTSTPTPSPTTPAPTSLPSPSPTPSPTPSPSPAPTSTSPTPAPTSSPTPSPTSSPTVSSPTSSPITSPTKSPATSQPSRPPAVYSPFSPSVVPTHVPSITCVHTGVEIVDDVLTQGECEQIGASGLCGISAVAASCSSTCCFTLAPTTPAPTHPPTTTPTIRVVQVCIHTEQEMVEDTLSQQQCVSVRASGQCAQFATECNSTCCYTQTPSTPPTHAPNRAPTTLYPTPSPISYPTFALVSYPTPAPIAYYPVGYPSHAPIGFPTPAPTNSPTPAPVALGQLTASPIHAPSVQPTSVPSTICIHTGLEQVGDTLSQLQCGSVKDAGNCPHFLVECSTTCCFTVSPTMLPSSSSPSLSPTLSPTPPSQPPTSASPTGSTTAPTLATTCVHTSWEMYPDLKSKEECTGIRDSMHCYRFRDYCNTTCCYFLTAIPTSSQPTTAPTTHPTTPAPTVVPTTSTPTQSPTKAPSMNMTAVDPSTASSVDAGASVGAGVLGAVLIIVLIIALIFVVKTRRKDKQRKNSFVMDAEDDDDDDDDDGTIRRQANTSTLSIGRFVEVPTIMETCLKHPNNTANTNTLVPKQKSIEQQAISENFSFLPIDSVTTPPSKSKGKNKNKNTNKNKNKNKNKSKSKSNSKNVSESESESESKSDIHSLTKRDNMYVPMAEQDDDGVYEAVSDVVVQQQGNPTSTSSTSIRTSGGGEEDSQYYVLPVSTTITPPPTTTRTTTTTQPPTPPTTTRTPTTTTPPPTTTTTTTPVSPHTTIYVDSKQPTHWTETDVDYDVVPVSNPNPATRADSYLASVISEPNDDDVHANGIDVLANDNDVHVLAGDEPAMYGEQSMYGVPTLHAPPPPPSTTNDNYDTHPGGYMEPNQTSVPPPTSQQSQSVSPTKTNSSPMSGTTPLTHVGLYAAEDEDIEHGRVITPAAANKPKAVRPTPGPVVPHTQPLIAEEGIYDVVPITTTLSPIARALPEFRINSNI